MGLESLQKEIFRMIRNSEEHNSCDYIRQDSQIPVSKRLKTYQKSSYLKPYSCLSDDFQVTKKILGDLLFKELAQKYFKLHPPDTHFINEVGLFFPQFLAENIDSQKFPFLHELSKLEWLRVSSFYDFYNFHHSPLEEQQILVNPSLKTYSSSWPLHKIWHKEKSYAKRSTQVFIWTTEDRRVHVQAWTKNETKVLNQLVHKSLCGNYDSHSLEMAIEELLKIMEQKELTKILTAKLTEWIQLGLMEITS